THLINASVTLRATDTLVYVGTVIEVYKVGKVMNPHPADRLIRTPALTHRFQHSLLGVHLRVTRHTHLGRRYLCMARSLHTEVTVSTVQPETTDVVLMRKLHGLHILVTLSSHVSGLIVYERSRKRRARQEDESYDCSLNLVIYIFMV